MAGAPRPRHGDRAQANRIDLGIDRCRVQAAVPQHVSDLLQRCAGAQHAAGGGVAQDVRSTRQFGVAAARMGQSHRCPNRIQRDPDIDRCRLAHE